MRKFLSWDCFLERTNLVNVSTRFPDTAVSLVSKQSLFCCSVVLVVHIVDYRLYLQIYTIYYIDHHTLLVFFESCLSLSNLDLELITVSLLKTNWLANRRLNESTVTFSLLTFESTFMQHCTYFWALWLLFSSIQFTSCVRRSQATQRKGFLYRSFTPYVMFVSCRLQMMQPRAYTNIHYIFKRVVPNVALYAFRVHWFSPWQHSKKFTMLTCCMQKQTEKLSHFILFITINLRNCTHVHDT